MSASVGKAYQTLGKLSRDPHIRDVYEQRVKFEATKLSEADYKYKPLLEEKDRQIASQANQLAEKDARIAEKDAQLADMAARMAEMERMLSGKI
jgi:hypothetical protein